MVPWLPSSQMLAAESSLIDVVDPETEHGGSTVVEPLSLVDPALDRVVRREVTEPDRLHRRHQALVRVLRVGDGADEAAVPLEDAGHLLAEEGERDALVERVRRPDVVGSDPEA